MGQRGGKDLSCIGIIVDDENPNAPEIRRARESSLRHSVTRVPDLFAVVEELRQPPEEQEFGRRTKVGEGRAG